MSFLIQPDNICYYCGFPAWAYEEDTTRYVCESCANSPALDLKPGSINYMPSTKWVFNDKGTYHSVIHTEADHQRLSEKFFEGVKNLFKK